jgi:hypothetical protein
VDTAQQGQGAVGNGHGLGLQLLARRLQERWLERRGKSCVGDPMPQQQEQQGAQGPKHGTQNDLVTGAHEGWPKGT